MPVPPAALDKTKWLLVTASMAASIPLYVAVAFFVGSQGLPPSDGGPGPALRIIFYVVAFGLLSSAFVVMPSVKGPGEAALLPTRQQFLAKSLLSTALAEAAAIMGLVLFFLERKIVDIALLSGCALFLIALHVIPNGLSYWAALSNMESPGSSTTPG